MKIKVKLQAMTKNLKRITMKEKITRKKKKKNQRINMRKKKKLSTKRKRNTRNQKLILLQMQTMYQEI